MSSSNVPKLNVQQVWSFNDKSEPELLFSRHNRDRNMPVINKMIESTVSAVFDAKPEQEK